MQAAGTMYRRVGQREEVVPDGGCLDSVDWSNGMERWNGMEWNVEVMEY